MTVKRFSSFAVLSCLLKNYPKTDVVCVFRKKIWWLLDEKHINSFIYAFLDSDGKILKILDMVPCKEDEWR